MSFFNGTIYTDNAFCDSIVIRKCKNCQDYIHRIKKSVLSNFFSVSDEICVSLPFRLFNVTEQTNASITDN
jgi:hypothetical protein